MAPMFEQHRLRDEQERVAHTALRFLRSRVKLDEMVAAGASKGAIPFEEIDSFVQDQLFELKEDCHWLFRYREGGEEAKPTLAMLFDILVGSLFHQMMKVKENSYQVERYSPKYAALRAALQGPDAPERADTFLREGERIVARARRVLHREFSYAIELFNEATLVLRHVLIEHRDNPLLLRSLVENEKLLDAVYGQHSLERLFREMHEDRPAQGFILAATDFFEGGWYERARGLCQRARKADPKNKAAAQLLNRINAAVNAHLS